MRFSSLNKQEFKALKQESRHSVDSKLHNIIQFTYVIVKLTLGTHHFLQSPFFSTFLITSIISVLCYLHFRLIEKRRLTTVFRAFSNYRVACRSTCTIANGWSSRRVWWKRPRYLNCKSLFSSRVWSHHVLFFPTQFLYQAACTQRTPMGSK